MEKKTPMRMCTGCREMKPKKELIRAVKSPEGEISLDTTGKKPGRGAYFCKDPECFKRMRKSKALERTFKKAISEEIYNSMERELNE